MANIIDKILIKEIIVPVCIIIVAFLLNLIIKRLVKRTIRLKVKKFDSKKHKTIIGLIENIIKYFIIIIAILMILDAFGIDTKTLIASLGIIGLAIGLSLQDIIKDFLAGFTIIIDNQYTVGDIVTIGTFKGEVINLGLKTTKLKAFTGEVKIISNRNIIEVINHSLENSLIIIDIPFPNTSDIKKVEIALVKASNELNDEVKELTAPIKFLGINKYNLSSIEFRLIAETKPLKKDEVERKINKKIKEVIDKNKL